MSQELNDLANKGVLQKNEMLGHVLKERQKAALGVEPSVCAQLLLVGLQALHDTRDAELIVSFGTVQCT